MSFCLEKSEYETVNIWKVHQKSGKTGLEGRGRDVREERVRLTFCDHKSLHSCVQRNVVYYEN